MASPRMEADVKKTIAAWLTILALLPAYLGIAQSQTPAPAHFPYTVTIGPGSQTVKSGSNVSIGVTVTNATDGTVATPPIEMEAMEIAVDVLQAGGKSAELTDRGRVWHQKGGWSGGGPSFPMEPGATAHRKIVVSDLYDLTRPGKYLIKLRRDDISSNSITVEIIP